MSIPKKIFAAGALFAVALSAWAGTPRAALWENALECRAEKRPLDAAAALGEIAAACAAENAWSEYALAVELRADAGAEPAGKNAALARVRALSSALDAAPSELARIFLEARLAWALADLADFPPAGTLRAGREGDPAGTPPEDLAEWSSAQLAAEARRRYENVLAQEPLLKKIPAAAVEPKRIFDDETRERLVEKLGKNSGAGNFLAGTFSLNDASRAEFPTLYDFIARDAEIFFTRRAEADFRRSRRSREEIAENAALFASPQEFVESVDASVPAEDPLARALQILSERTRFHLGDADKSALARATLDRFTWATDALGAAASREHGEAAEAALRNFLVEYEYFPISAEAAARLAELLIAQDREPEAHEIAEKAVAAYGNAKNANACKNLLLRLSEEKIFVESVPGTWLASAPTRFDFRAKNMRQIRFRAVPAVWRDHLKREFNRPDRLSEKEIRALLAAENAVEWSLPVENFYDFREHDYAAKIPAGTLAPGFYFVFLAPNDKPFGEAGAGEKPYPVWVGDVAAIRAAGTPADADGTLRLRVVNAVTGTPIEGAGVFAWNKARWGGDRVAVPEVKTDALGEAVISGLKKDRDPVVLVECALPGADGAEPRVHAVSIERVDFSAPPRERAEARTISLFTDREIFRPGQKISFKGVLAAPRGNAAGKAEVFPGKKVTVELKAAFGGEDRVAARTEVWSNGFGSFAGTLDVPRSLALGRYALVPRCEGFENAARALVFVEEYRRPKSEAAIALVSEPRILGGNAAAVVTGTAFDGAPLDRAKVRWSVSRAAFYGDPADAIVARGEGELDAEGKLKISWETKRAKLDEHFAEALSADEHRAEELRNRTFFRVFAEITDAAGETVEHEEIFALFNSSLEPVAKTPENFFLGEAGGELRVECSARERASGAPRVGVPATLEIFRLVEPEEIDDGTAFPRKRLAAGEKIFSAPVKTAESGVPAAKIPAEKLRPGRYRAVLSCRDDFGQTVSAEREFSVFDPAAEKCPQNRVFLLAEKSPGASPKVGETAKFIWGSGHDSARAFAEVFVRGERIAAFYTEPGRTQQEIAVPATEAMRGEIATLRVSQMRDGAFRQSRAEFFVDPEKNLKIERERVKTALVPGAAEIWTFRITREDGSPADATEALAALYDVSAETLLGRNARGAWERVARALAEPRSWFPTSALAVGAQGGSFRFAERGKFFPNFEPPAWTRDAFPREIRDGVPAPLLAAENAFWSVSATGAGAAAKTASESDSADAESAAKNPRAHTRDADLPVRKNLQETAFFYPFLRTDEDGTLTIRFVVPEALTRWRFRLFAHDENLRAGTLEIDDVLTSKDLTARPEAPRFLREGDALKFPVKIANRSAEDARGNAEIRIEFFSADGEKIDAPQKSPERQEFSVPAKSSTTLFREIDVPDGAAEARFRAVVKSGDVADGEEGSLPVLSREVVLTESRGALLRPGAETKLVFENLAAEDGSAREILFALDAPTNAFESALLALPRFAEQARETDSSDAIFDRLYANALAKSLCDAEPELRRLIERKSRAADDGNADSAALSASPFRDFRRSEAERTRALAEFFDENKIREETRAALEELESRLERENGEGWAWYPDSRYGANPAVTRRILVGLGRLRERVGDAELKSRLDALARRPLAAQDARVAEAFRKAPDAFTFEIAQSLYLRSLFADESAFPQSAPEAYRHFLKAAEKPENWARLPRALQAQVALALFRAGEKSVPAKIVESLRQRAVVSETLGMSWNDVPAPTFPRRPAFSPIEAQAAAIELFTEATDDGESVEAMKIWLLAQKRTHVWPTSAASADAVFALFLGNGGEQSGGVKIPASAFARGNVKFADADGKPLAPGTLVPAKALSEISAKNEGGAPAFVSASRTFSQALSAVRADAPAAGFSVKKAIFLRERAPSGKIALEPARLKILRPGDELVVRLTIRADRDFEFVRVRDMRGSGLEPGEKISGRRVSGGLAFHAEPRDAETRFYFERLPAGTHVIEYVQRVRFSGMYLSGFAEIQSLYAPEHSARSDTETIVAM